MSQANVKATDSIEAVKAALANFGKQTTDGLAELEAEVRRTIEWLEHDRPPYWKERIRRAHDKVGEARDDLQRCLTFHASESHRPSCTEQKVALKKAQAHLEYCREKQERLKHWIRELSHEMHEYQGRVSNLTVVAESDIPAAMNALERILLTIEQYTLGSATSLGSRSGSGGTAEGTNESAGSEE